MCLSYTFVSLISSVLLNCVTNQNRWHTLQNQTPAKLVPPKQIWVVKFHFLFIPPLFYRHQRHQHRSCCSFHHHPCRSPSLSPSSTSKLPPFWPPPLSSFRHGNRFTFSITIINTDVAAVFTPPSSSFRRRSGMDLTTNVAFKKNKITLRRSGTFSNHRHQHRVATVFSLLLGW